MSEVNNQNIILDLNPSIPVSYVSAKQADYNSRTITYTITNNGEEYNNRIFKSAVLRVHRPDGNTICNFATVSSNSPVTVTATLTPEDLSVAGRAYCDVALLDFNPAGSGCDIIGTNHTIITTAPFILDIIKGAVNESNIDQVTSSDDYKYFNSFVPESLSKIGVTVERASLDSELSVDAAVVPSSEGGDNGLKIHFRIPQSYINFLNFETDPSTGQLYMYRPVLDSGYLDNLNFSINESGYLQVEVLQSEDEEEEIDDE